MERVWLRDYPPGVPAEIDPDSVGPPKQLFEDACREHAAARLHEHGRTPATSTAVAALRRLQQHEAGLAVGDRIALMMPNVLQYRSR